MLESHEMAMWGAISLLIIALAIACRAKLPLVSITELFHVPLCLLGLKLLASEGSSVFEGLLYVGRHFGLYMAISVGHSCNQ